MSPTMPHMVDLQDPAAAAAAPVGREERWSWRRRVANP
jgi:hypothetical protein